MASSRKAAPVVIDLVTDSSSDEGSVRGFIRLRRPGSAPAAEREVLDSDAVTESDEDEAHEEEDEAEEDLSAEENAWETESFYADALSNMPDAQDLVPDEHTCTPEESKYYRKRLREIGGARLLEETVHKRKITARKLSTAFGIRPPNFLDGAPDQAVIPFLKIAMARELTMRRKLPHINTLEDLAKLLKKSKNILVLTGAGISTSLGIPDFRSKNGGLYSRLTNLGLSDPQEVFDIHVFQDDPTVFYSIARDILPSTEKFSPTHAFIELLQRKNKLLTQYTQNIDNIEARAGIRPDKLIQCHGSFATASCMKCGYKVEGEVIFPDLRAGRVAKCVRCIKQASDALKAGRKRKRASKGHGGSNNGGGAGRKQKYSEDSSADEDENAFHGAGVMKPDITFFGEQLPDLFHERLVDHDQGKADLVICIGTSLQVAPVSEIIGYMPPDVPQIYISKTPVTHVQFDIELIGSCDDVVVELCRLVGWKLEHEMIPKNLKLHVKPVEDKPGQYEIDRV